MNDAASWLTLVALALTIVAFFVSLWYLVAVIKQHRTTQWSLIRTIVYQRRTLAALERAQKVVDDINKNFEEKN